MKLKLKLKLKFGLDRDGILWKDESKESVETRYNERSRGMTNCRGPPPRGARELEERGRHIYFACAQCSAAYQVHSPSRKGKLHFSNVSRGGEFDRGHTHTALSIFKASFSARTTLATLNSRDPAFLPFPFHSSPGVKSFVPLPTSIEHLSRFRWLRIEEFEKIGQQFFPIHRRVKIYYSYYFFSNFPSS